MPLKRFFKRLNRHYPELGQAWLRLAQQYWEVPGRDEHPAAMLIEDPGEQRRARATLDAMFKDAVDGAAAAIIAVGDKKISQDECWPLFSTPIRLGIAMGFTLGVWTAQAGFARFPPEQRRNSDEG